VREAAKLALFLKIVQLDCLFNPGNQTNKAPVHEEVILESIEKGLRSL
jgi:hypothetical protein